MTQTNAERPEAPAIDEGPPSPETASLVAQVYSVPLAADAPVPTVTPPAPSLKQGGISRAPRSSVVTTDEATTAAAGAMSRPLLKF